MELFDGEYKNNDSRENDFEVDSEADAEARSLIGAAIAGQYYALYHIWIETRNYVCYQEKLPGILSVIGKKGDYVPAWESYIEKYIVEEDREGMREFADISTLADRLKDKVSISHEYRRKNVGWTRGQFIAARRDECGNVTNVVYAVVDINAEKTMETARKKAVFDSHHDPLTGVFNRKGFEEAIRDAFEDEGPVGFAIFDIDYFKSVNDTFGHEVGDKAIKEVSDLLINVFRIDDSVFRIGGDEFGVLLRNCPVRAWDTLCEKQKRIHGALEGFYEDASITISTGIAFSPSDYSDEMYRLADEMLYEVKSRGRAGSACIDISTGEKRYWQDDAISRQAKNVLAFNNTGIYRIEYPIESNGAPRLICGNTTKELFGFPKDLGPEECYRLWEAGIEPSYIDVLTEARKMLVRGVQAECTYCWNHPKKGKILIRTGGVGEVVDGVQVLHGYHHSMVDTKVIERKDDRRLIMDAMSGIYFCSYYINLDDDSFSILKNAPGEDLLEIQESRATETLGQFLSTLVSGDDLERMKAFMDFGTLRERLDNEVHLDCEYLSKSDKGWCRATFFPVKHDASGRLTHVLFVITSLDALKAEEAKVEADNRRSIESLYNNVPGGIVMYEWDGKKLKTIHLSAYYEREYGYTLNSGVGEDRGPDFERVHPDDVDGYKVAILEALNVTHQLHYEYRVWNRSVGRYLWTCVDAVSEVQPDGTSLVYALYTDATSQKAILEDYENRLNQALGMVENSMVVGECNLSENYVGFFRASDEMKQFVEGAKTFDERFENAADYVVGEKARSEYRKTFNRENLLALVEGGTMQARMEYLLQVPNYRTVWLESGVNMVKNPLTGSITAISYTKNVQESRIPSLLLKSTIGREYLKTVVVLADSGEFYALDDKDDMSGECQYGFWERLAASLAPLTNANESDMRHEFGKDSILLELDQEGEFVRSFDSEYLGSGHRLQVRFSYLQKSQNLILVSLRNITDDTLMERLRHESEHDPLTDLYNRRTVFRKCAELLADYPDERFAMVHVDMRHFRLFNTFFGDDAGDKLLCDVADMFRWMDADYDHWAYGRIEADVFCAFFPFDEQKYLTHVSGVFEVLRNYSTDFVIEPVIGIYFADDRNMPVEAMFTRATLAAKSVTPSTPNATVVYDESLELGLSERQQIINDMQAAVDEEQFEVYLQPKYSLRTNRPVGAEALVRWIHPTNGMVSPGKFIPVFESNGFITVLDRYMWEHVCQLLRKWMDGGKPLAPVSVNVSRLSMFGADTVDFLKNLVKRYGIDPSYLELELTESAYIDDPEEIKANLTELREAGFKILLDDFGSGYSSLNTLRELPVDVLKLDLRFLPLDMAQDVRGGLVLSSIVRMSKLLNLSVIAEGVELQEHADFLKGIGCEYVQGFLFAKPMPVSDYERLLVDGDADKVKADKHAISHLGKILAETDTGTYAMGAVIPIPLAFLEYRAGSFAFLRVNPEFFDEFDLNENLEPASLVFKQRLTKESYSLLINAFEKSVETGKKQQVSIDWITDAGEVRCYACKVSCEGSIGDAATMVVVFTNITNEVEL